MGKKHASQYANFGWLHVSAKEIDVFYLNAEHSIISLSFQLMKDECL